MTIYTIKDLIKAAFRLPVKWKQSFVNNLEDWDEQLKIWEKNPEKLNKDESTHKGIVCLARVLLGMKPKETEQG